MDKQTEMSMDSVEYSLLMGSLDVSVSKHILDEHYTVIWANDRYYDMFGYTKEEYEALFHNQCDLYYRNNSEDWAALVSFVSEAFGRGDTKYSYVCRMYHRSGKKLWIKLTGNLTGEIVNGFPVSYSVMVDITEQMQLQVEHSVTINNFPGLLAKFKVTPEGFCLYEANERYYQYFPDRRDFRREEMTKEQGLQEVAERYDSFQQGLPASFTISPLNREGRHYYFRVTAECVDWENGGPVYLLIYTDITQLTEQNAQLEYLAYTDRVTGGMNRTKFDLTAAEAICAAPAGTYALVWLDLQKFKLINDIGGNELGDQVLKYIYEKLCAHISAGEFLSRITADNYTLLLKRTSDKRVVERLIEMGEDINSFNDKYVLSFTAGIYRVDDSELEITLIEDRAHVAQRGIQKGDGRVCTCRFYDDQERVRLQSEKNMENRMWQALDRGEFVVYLQPKRLLKDSSVAGAEALVRWLDPEEGLISPDQFIPYFERNGFIVTLDLYVFDRVCALLRGWLDAGRKAVPISVNMSRYHFSDADFMTPYADICKKWNVPAALLEIEVTETVAFENPEAFADIVSKIHAHGFSCSMDDFGSGYSSLNILKDIDVDVLKLDRAFFSEERMEDTRAGEVVSAVVTLAKKLRMSTVAEGVEVPYQEDFLRKSGCDMVQGYVFSRPLPVKDFERLVFSKN